MGSYPRMAPRAGGGSRLSNVLLLTGGHESPAEILPSLTLLPHSVRVAAAVAASVAASPPPDAVLVDARRDLVQAKRLLQALRSVERAAPVLAIVTEGGWAAVAADWGADDIVLYTAGPGEVEARLRLAIGRITGATHEQSGEIRSGELVINEATYSARMTGRSLDLTFKEFELLKFLTQQPGRVFTRAQLLQEVWGYDYFGGTRTVDVHVRRLRAKLGAENESLIGTVRNVGYRFVPAKGGAGRAGDGDPADPEADLILPGDTGLPDREFSAAGGDPGGFTAADAGPRADVPAPGSGIATPGAGGRHEGNLPAGADQELTDEARARRRAPAAAPAAGYAARPVADGWAGATARHRVGPARPDR
jgi:DNA-binding response OmpR family regulator